MTTFTLPGWSAHEAFFCLQGQMLTVGTVHRLAWVTFARRRTRPSTLWGTPLPPTLALRRRSAHNPLEHLLERCWALQVSRPLSRALSSTAAAPMEPGGVCRQVGVAVFQGNCPDRTEQVPGWPGPEGQSPATATPGCRLSPCPRPCTPEPRGRRVFWTPHRLLATTWLGPLPHLSLRLPGVCPRRPPPPSAPA